MRSFLVAVTLAGVVAGSALAQDAKEKESVAYSLHALGVSADDAGKLIKELTRLIPGAAVVVENGKLLVVAPKADHEKVSALIELKRLYGSFSPTDNQIVVKRYDLGRTNPHREYVLETVELLKQASANIIAEVRGNTLLLAAPLAEHEQLERSGFSTAPPPNASRPAPRSSGSRPVPMPNAAPFSFRGQAAPPFAWPVPVLQPPEKVEYEYRWERVRTDDGDESTNKLGADGWEAVSALPLPPDQDPTGVKARVMFKRRKPAQAFQSYIPGPGMTYEGGTYAPPRTYRPGESGPPNDPPPAE